MFDFDEIAEDPGGAGGGADPEAQQAADDLASSDPQVRWDACTRLVQLGMSLAEPFIPKLEGLAKTDDDYDVQRAAKKALKDLKAGVGVKPRAAAAPPPAAAAPAPAAAAAEPEASAPADGAAADAAAGDGTACGGALECRVLQGPLIKKLGTDPAASSGITKLKRKVGSKVKTTGKTWTGPSGGEWVELDPSAEKPGWLLVEGPGFNQPGPLLERAEPDEEEPLVLKVTSPIEGGGSFEICVKPDQKIRQAKAWIVLHIPGLRADRIVATREKEGRQDASFMLEDSMKMRDTPFKASGEFFFVYNGDVEEDIEAYKAKLKG